MLNASSTTSNQALHYSYIQISFHSQEDTMRLLKKFATSLLLYGGPMAYNHTKKLETALPSLRTVQRAIQLQYHSLSETQLCFDASVNHLKKYNTPFFVAISEDATLIISRVEYD